MPSLGGTLNCTLFLFMPYVLDPACRDRRRHSARHQQMSRWQEDSPDLAQDWDSVRHVGHEKPRPLREVEDNPQGCKAGTGSLPADNPPGVRSRRSVEAGTSW